MYVTSPPGLASSPDDRCAERPQVEVRNGLDEIPVGVESEDTPVVAFNETANRDRAVEQSAVVVGVVDDPIRAARFVRRVLRQHEKPPAAARPRQRLALAIVEGLRRAPFDRERDIAPASRQNSGRR